MLETRLTEPEVPAEAGTATEMMQPQTPEVGAGATTEILVAQAAAARLLSV